MSRPTPVWIAPSVLAADFTRLGEQVREAQEGGADLIHVDVMDGRFVPNISMGIVVVEAIRRVAQIPLDVHLMIVEPEKYLADFVQAGPPTSPFTPKPPPMPIGPCSASASWGPSQGWPSTQLPPYPFWKPYYLTSI